MRRRFQSKNYDEINLTPLLDTVFNLLIIFMITAPLLEYSIDVSPPKMDAVELNADESSKIINVTKEKTIRFEGKTVSMDALLIRLSQLKSSPRGKRMKIFLRADKDLRYGDVIHVLKTVKKAGHGDISLVTETER